MLDMVPLFGSLKVKSNGSCWWRRKDLNLRSLDNESSEFTIYSTPQYLKGWGSFVTYPRSNHNKQKRENHTIGDYPSMVQVDGFEPSTFRVSDGRTNQLYNTCIFSRRFSFYRKLESNQRCYFLRVMSYHLTISKT